MEVYQIEVTSTIIVIIHQRHSRKLSCSFYKSQTRREIKGILNFISNKKTIRYISETVTNWDIIVIPYHRNHAQETSTVLRVLLQKYFIMFFICYLQYLHVFFCRFEKLPLWFIYAKTLSRQLWTLCMFVDMYLQNLYYNHKATKQHTVLICMLCYIIFFSLTL